MNEWRNQYKHDQRGIVQIFGARTLRAARPAAVWVERTSDFEIFSESSTINYQSIQPNVNGALQIITDYVQKITERFNQKAALGCCSWPLHTKQSEETSNKIESTPTYNCLLQATRKNKGTWETSQWFANWWQLKALPRETLGKEIKKKRIWHEESVWCISSVWACHSDEHHNDLIFVF